MRRIAIVVMSLLVVGCAGFQKGCASFSNSNLGGDWLVVQFDMNGKPFNCWKLQGAVVESEDGGNVSWLDPHTGHLVHISGWENRIQVSNANFSSAAHTLGIDLNQCEDGRYPVSR